MKPTLPLLVIFLPLTTTALPNCPLLGPEFPPPRNLSAHPIWQSALTDLSALYDYLDTSNTTGLASLSYSIQVFSTNPGPPLLWERHRTARDLPADTLGVKQVDGDTVYRLGSVSKVIAVLTWLAESGDVFWRQPITKFLPELARFAGRTKAKDFDPLRETAWDDVTIEALAAQVGGLQRDCKLCPPFFSYLSYASYWREVCANLAAEDGVLGEITQTEDVPKEWLAPFPALSTLSSASSAPCGVWPLCSRERESWESIPVWQKTKS